jgi:hypothetical protein
MLHRMHPILPLLPLLALAASSCPGAPHATKPPSTALVNKSATDRNRGQRAPAAEQ